MHEAFAGSLSEVFALVVTLMHKKTTSDPVGPWMDVDAAVRVTGLKYFVPAQAGGRLRHVFVSVRVNYICRQLPPRLQHPDAEVRVVGVNTMDGGCQGTRLHSTRPHN